MSGWVSRGPDQRHAHNTPNLPHARTCAQHACTHTRANAHTKRHKVSPPTCQRPLHPRCTHAAATNLTPTYRFRGNAAELRRRRFPIAVQVRRAPVQPVTVDRGRFGDRHHAVAAEGRWWWRRWRRRLGVELFFVVSSVPSTTTVVLAFGVGIGERWGRCSRRSPFLAIHAHEQTRVRTRTRTRAHAHTCTRAQAHKRTDASTQPSPAHLEISSSLSSCAT